MNKRGLGIRFFGWIRPSTNDNFTISHLKAAIKSEKENLFGRKKAIRKYQRYMNKFPVTNIIHKQASKMLTLELKAIPMIQRHIDYLEEELREEEILNR